MDFEQYKRLDRMNASTLVHGLHSMRRLKRYIDKGGEEEVTACMSMGIAKHVLLLEPNQFEERYVVMPSFQHDPDNKTKDGKPSKEKTTSYYKDKVTAFAAANPGKEIIERYQYDKCLYAIECLRAHHFAPKLLEDIETEVTLEGEIFGIPAKGRLDVVSVALNHLTDLKNSRTAHLRRFERIACDLAYDFKLAWYRELWRQNYNTDPDVFVIVQEDDGDFDTCVRTIDAAELDIALEKIEEVCSKYKQCLKTGKWHGVDEGSPSVPLIFNWKRDELANADFSALNAEVEQAF